MRDRSNSGLPATGDTGSCKLDVDLEKLEPELRQFASGLMMAIGLFTLSAPLPVTQETLWCRENQGSLIVFHSSNVQITNRRSDL